MKTFILLFTPLFLLISCNSEVNNSLDNELEGQDKITTIVPEVMDSATLELIEWDQNYDVYQGNYFSIEYPSNFIAAPLEPTVTTESYTFIDSDEATFTSPNGEVEFFVYSPLWGGEPQSYLEQLDNEEITAEKETTDLDEIGFERTIKWITYSDKDGQYSRSFVSTKTESTDLVFGIKSINDAAYEKYKEAYLRFKESLTQFADA
ncbi:MAG: hypothetical protein GQ574_16580 [Crocinitomix sp.]|nr:hypothetical protein [Crocinitomix sp.]